MIVLPSLPLNSPVLFAVYPNSLGRTYLTTHDVARLVGASPSTVLTWVDRGWLAAHRTPGGHRRIHRGALADFLREHHMPALDARAGLFTILMLIEGQARRERLASSFRAHPRIAEVLEASTAIEGLARLHQTPPEALVLDAHFPGIEVVGLLRQILALPATAHVRAIVCCPSSDHSLCTSLREIQVAAVVDTQTTATELLRHVLADEAPNRTIAPEAHPSQHP